MPSYNKLFSDRQSCRSYSSKPVETEDIINCIKAARLAPSAHNSQPYSFVLVNNKEIVEKIAPSFKNGEYNNFCDQCQAFLFVMEEPLEKDLGYSLIDIGMVTLQFCLAATEAGLGTCIIGNFDEAFIRGIIDIKSTGSLRVGVAIGYPQSTEIRRKMRKNLQQLVQVIEK